MIYTWAQFFSLKGLIKPPPPTTQPEAEGTGGLSAFICAYFPRFGAEAAERRGLSGVSPPPRPLPASKRYLGSCVLLPLPVSPVTMRKGCSLTASTRARRYRRMGRAAPAMAAAALSGTAHPPSRDAARKRRADDIRCLRTPNGRRGPLRPAPSLSPAPAWAHTSFLSHASSVNHAPSLSHSSSLSHAPPGHT